MTEKNFSSFEARIAKLEALVEKLSTPRNTVEVQVEALLREGKRPAEVVAALKGTGPKTSPATLYRTVARVAPRIQL